MISKKKHNELSKNHQNIQPTVTPPELSQLSVEELNKVIGGRGIHDTENPDPDWWRGNTGTR